MHQGALSRDGDLRMVKQALPGDEHVIPASPGKVFIQQRTSCPELTITLPGPGEAVWRRPVAALRAIVAAHLSQESPPGFWLCLQAPLGFSTFTAEGCNSTWNCIHMKCPAPLKSILSALFPKPPHRETVIKVRGYPADPLTISTTPPDG